MNFKKGDRAKQIRYVTEKNPFVTIMRVSEAEWIYHKHDDVKYKNAKDYGCCNSEDLVLIKKSTLTKKEKKVEKKKFYGHPRFYELVEKIKDLHSRKNYNYARKDSPLSNFLQCERFGIPAPYGCLVRMTDKDDRRIEVLLKGDVVGEAITDTSQDDSVYNLIFVILWEEFLKNKNAKEIMRKFKEIKELLEEGK